MILMTEQLHFQEFIIRNTYRQGKLTSFTAALFIKIKEWKQLNTHQ